MNDQLAELAAILLAVSLASERFVALLKNVWPGYFASGSDQGRVESSAANDVWRRTRVMAAGFVASLITVTFLVPGVDSIGGWFRAALVGRITLGEQQWPVLLLAFLASGGSAFWAQVVAYASALKDIQRVRRDAGVAERGSGGARGAEFLNDGVPAASAGSGRPETPSAVGSPPAPRNAQAVLTREFGAGYDFVADAAPTTLGSGSTVVRLSQMHGGVRVWGQFLTVEFGPDGGDRSVGGRPVSLSADLSVTPTVSAAAACLVLADSMGIPIGTGPGPERVVNFPGASSATGIRWPEAFDGVVAAELVVWPGEDAPVLAWEVRGERSEHGEPVTGLVAARGEAVLLALLADAAHAVALDVWLFSPEESPVRQTVEIPRPASEFPDAGTVATPGFGKDWITGTRTEGNRVGAFVRNDRQGVAGGSTGADLRFSGADDDADRVITAFYHCNWLHDFFLRFGFDEASGCFQTLNHSGADGDGDRLRVQVFDDELKGIARMICTGDGREPRLKLGRRNDRHSALDPEIITHEYAHGVVNRLIGGPGQGAPLAYQEEARAMAEGYCDYFALSIQNFRRVRDGRSENWKFGAGIQPPDGLRPYPYDQHVGGYGDLRQAHALHDAGQVWGRALLMVMSSLEGGSADRAIGQGLAWRLVLDSLKVFAPAGRWPTFLDGRDAIYRAFVSLCDGGVIADPSGRIEADIRNVFRTLGMGAGAQSPSGRFKDIKPDNS